jgi:hypothetical protein
MKGMATAWCAMWVGGWVGCPLDAALKMDVQDEEDQQGEVLSCWTNDT